MNSSLCAVIVAILATTSFGFILLGVGVTAAVIRRVPGLARVAFSPPCPWPTLSVVMPACNEPDLGKALSAHLRTDYPNVEWIVVNDRSTDGTGEVAERMASMDPRVRVIHVRTLPEGWLGKTHALQRGIEAATGEWVLFADADVKATPDTLGRAIAYAENRDLDFLTAIPRLEATTPLLDAMCLSAMRQVLAGCRIWAVSNPRSDAILGIGAFSLFRRTAYNSTPGMEWLRLEVADDLGLAYMLKSSGARCGVVLGKDNLSLTFYESLRALAGHMDKSAFAIVGRFSFFRALNMSLLLLAISLGPLLGLLLPSAPWVGPLSAVALVLGYGTAFVGARWMGSPLITTFLFPFADIALAGFTVYAAARGAKRGGILWRGTFYPTALLRSAQRVRFPI
ncbi:MAG: glycosyltransferase [Myxococcales bacterium]|nr:glycosyltransferase [Myxococcales bacterium]